MIRLRVADAVRLAGLASLVSTLVAGQWVNTALFALVLLGLMLPRFLGAGPGLDLTYGVVLLFAAWSAVLDLYVTFGWLDVVVHALASGLTTLFAYRLLVGWSVLPAHPDPALRLGWLGTVLTAAAVGTSLGLLWELGEWFGHTYLDERIQVGYRDTLSDLVADGLGALAAGVFLAVRSRASSPPAMKSPATPPLSVSVVIPVKDDAAALERCLRLLGAQTVPPFEVVVVDNGSRDSSARVATAFGARVVPEPRPGIPAAAATGYDAARGEVIARCDADSRPRPDWIDRIGTRMATDPALDAVTGAGRFYDLPRWVEPVLRRLYLGSYYVFVHAALGHTTLWGSNMALRRSTWCEVSHLVHRLDPELHDDMDLSFSLGPARRVHYDPTLVMGVSARSMRGRRQLRRRLRRGFRTLGQNWEVLPPWERWRTRIALARDTSPAPRVRRP